MNVSAARIAQFGSKSGMPYQKRYLDESKV